MTNEELWDLCNNTSPKPIIKETKLPTPVDNTDFYDLLSTTTFKPKYRQVDPILDKDYGDADPIDGLIELFD